VSSRNEVSEAGHFFRQDLQDFNSTKIPLKAECVFSLPFGKSERLKIILNNPVNPV
jgi:hypothetical protein